VAGNFDMDANDLMSRCFRPEPFTLTMPQQEAPLIQFVLSTHIVLCVTETSFRQI
jgi:hypothetical protein